MKHTLHIASHGSELHLGLPDDADPAELLALCAEALRNARILEFSDLLPPGGIHRSTVVVNFAHVVGVWVSSEG
jgi:hypothetical protein